jgi:hypothetical protein
LGLASLATLASASLLLGACFLPIATGAPQPATTVGKGSVGVGFYEEAPTLNLTADEESLANAVAPAAAAVATVSYGLAEHTDVEASLEVAAYLFLLPLPVGGSVGLRHHAHAGGKLDVGLGVRVGGVAVGGDSKDSDGNTQTDKASAIYAAASATLQGAYGRFRPLVALQAMPLRISRELSGQADQSFTGLASSATLGLMFQLGALQLGPYGSATFFKSADYGGAGFFSLGLALGFRRDTRR